MAALRKTDKSFRLSWKDGLASPCRKMVRGSAAVKGNVAYFSTTTSRTVYVYNSVNEDWRTLPKCPTQYFSLAVIDGVLTAIGGFHSINPTPKLHSLVTADSIDPSKQAVERWSEIYPPMPTKRGGAAVACTDRYLIVAGGQLAVVLQIGGVLQSVEIMDIAEKHWYRVSNLPKAIAEPSMTLCGDMLYLMGGWMDDDRTRLVFSCSLQDLVQSKCKTTSPPCSPKSGPPSITWTSTADIPVYASTAASLSNNLLLAIGGCDEDENSVTSVYCYDSGTDCWNVIGNMATARYRAVVAVIPGDRIVVIGGCVSANGDFIGTGEIATLTMY